MSLQLRRPTLGYIIFTATKHARLLAWTAGFLSLAIVFYSCGERAADGKWSEKEVAAKVAYETQQARFAERLLAMEAERDRAKAAYVAQTLISDSLASHVKGRATYIPRVKLAARSDSLVDVCLGDPPTCYPTPRQIAEVTAAQDSLIAVVITQMIPQMEAERVRAAYVIDQYAMALTLEKEAHEATKGRLADVEKAHRLQHTPTLKQRIATTGKDLAIVGPCTALGIFTSNVGVAMGCSMIGRAVFR